MNTRITRWAPALLLATGALLTVGVNTQQAMPLRSSLSSTIPVQLLGYQGMDVTISAEEQRVAGMSHYLMRSYRPAEGVAAAGFTLYVGYYNSQTQGSTIHSPKNCLPGAGWEALTARKEMIPTANGAVPVNRYLIQKGDQRALVLYWYQGRGRVAADEYAVKWDLVRDAALRGRTEEALVRVIVPVVGSEADAFQQALKVAQSVIPGVSRALPAAG